MPSLKTVLPFLCLWTVIAASTPFDPTSLNEQKANDVFTCLSEVICAEREPGEVFEIVNAGKGSAQLFKDILKTISKASGFELKSTKEEWSTVPDNYCPMTHQEKISRFSDMCTNLGVIYKKGECEVQHEKDYCVSFDLVNSELEAFLKKFTDLKICGNPLRTTKQWDKPMGKMMG